MSTDKLYDPLRRKEVAATPEELKKANTFTARYL